MPDSDSRAMPPAVVAVAAWLVPGAGYWLIGQRARALTSGITIIILFVMGLLIGGIRLIDVPGYGDHGLPLEVSPNSDAVFESEPGRSSGGWVMFSGQAISEIRNKPWSIPQILAGPIDILASAGSVAASRPSAQTHQPLGARSHSRTNELGVLYTAVAGMLNLLVIIDATSRAARAAEGAK